MIIAGYWNDISDLLVQVALTGSVEQTTRTEHDNAESLEVAIAAEREQTMRIEHEALQHLFSSPICLAGFVF